MAHEKLSPRQKMIGMMYLVLTAMLALNVSKEAVKAFKKVDKSLTLTIENYVKKNNLIYAEFDRAAAENPAKAGKYKTAAYAVKERADETFNYIQGLKIEIIKKADGEDAAAVTGTAVNIDLVEKYDENNIPSEVLVGANESGKGFALKTMLTDYREFLITTLEGKNPSSEEILRKSLSTDDGKDENGQTEPWANNMFQTLPVVGAIALLSKMQVDVRNAETEVLNNLYAQIDASSFKFNKLKAIVIPDANYVTIGSDYKAVVFISATDTTQTPDIVVGNSQLNLDEMGRGVYTSRASSPAGSRTWGGVINLKSPNGTVVAYPFTSSYTVGEPNVICSPTAMNVMYMGIPNPLDVSVPGFSPNQISINVVNGIQTTERVKNSKGEDFRGTYFIKPTSTSQDVQIIVSTKDANGKLNTYKPYTFRVKPLPKPEGVFGGKNSGTIPKNTALAQTGVFAKLNDFDFDLVYKVTGFSVFYSGRLGEFEEFSTSGNLTQKQKDLINSMTRGQTLIIKNIKAVGPDNLSKDLSPVLLKLD
jgi:gliding motility-associated protein GldM